MTKLELKSSHEVVYTVYVADVESIFYCKPTDPDILTVLMKDGKRLYCDEVCPLQEEPVSEDLNEAAIAYNKKVNFVCAGEIPNEHFMAGANWQKQKDEHLFDKEFSAGYTEGQLAEISQSTIDAIREEYKQRMMKNAYKGYVSYIRDDSESVVYLKDSCITMPSYFPKSNLKDGDNIRIIVIKDE